MELFENELVRIVVNEGRRKKGSERGREKKEEREMKGKKETN